MDYKRIYDQLIDLAKQRIPPEGYVEHHHILPKCMGGSDDRSNIAVLTPEEHFVAHVLLVKIYPEVKDLIIAVSKMTSGRRGKLKVKHRRLYGWLRRKHAERMRELNSGSGNPHYGTMWIHQGTNNKRIKKDEPIPEGWNLGRRIRLNYCKVCDLPIHNQRKYCKLHKPKPNPIWCVGKRISEETKQKISLSLKGRIGASTGLFWITNGIKNKMIPIASSIPEGFRRGKVHK